MQDSPAWRAAALLSCDEMRRAEALSVARGAHSFFDLMQVAGAAVARAVQDHFPVGRILVLCGTGNNGGDGYVAARCLREAGRDVRVAVLGPPGTADAAASARLWTGEVVSLADGLPDADIIVDALFGTGLSRPLDGLAAQIIAQVKARALPVISADMPSGLCGDTGRVLGAAMTAQITVTFFRKKRGHILLPGATQAGRVIVADTGMDADVLDEVRPLITENHIDLWRDMIPRPQVQGHKYDRGHAVVFGGAEMTGASRLAARAVQRMGAGLVTLLAPEGAWDVYAKALESVIVLKDNQRDEVLADSKRNALLIGPGLGLSEASRGAVIAALATRKPCVLDADALTLFARKPDFLFQLLHKDCVLTPHEGEFIRLFDGRIDGQADKITRAQQAAKLAGCTVLLKGADTVIAEPDGTCVVSCHAPPWLATGGSGDVLAGMIAGLLTSGMEPLAAASAAAYIHGDCAYRCGPGLIAEDLVNAIPAFWAGFYGVSDA